jgi:hypothetical protein
VGVRGTVRTSSFTPEGAFYLGAWQCSSDSSPARQCWGGYPGEGPPITIELTGGESPSSCPRLTFHVVSVGRGGFACEYLRLAFAYNSAMLPRKLTPGSAS